MAVTVNYAWGPVPSTQSYITGTVPPTAAQSALQNRIAALVNFGADADTVAIVTHNWGLTASQLGNLQPIVILTPQTVGTAAGFYSVQLLNSVAIQISKGTTAAGSGETTFLVEMLLPFSELL